MEKLFLPIGSYENILAQIGRWKVISIKNLYEIMPVAISYQGFAKQIRKLESSGFISSFLFPDKSKYIYLTRKGVMLVPYGVEYSHSKEMIVHDLKCGIVLRELLKFENFMEGQILGDKSEGLSPDAKILAKKKDKEYVSGKGSIQTAHDFFRFSAFQRLSAGDSPVNVSQRLVHEYQERTRKGELPEAIKSLPQEPGINLNGWWKNMGLMAECS